MTTEPGEEHNQAGLSNDETYIIERSGRSDVDALAYQADAEGVVAELYVEKMTLDLARVAEA